MLIKESFWYTTIIILIRSTIIVVIIEPLYIHLFRVGLYEFYSTLLKLMFFYSIILVFLLHFNSIDLHLSVLWTCKSPFISTRLSLIFCWLDFQVLIILILFYWYCDLNLQPPGCNKNIFRAVVAWTFSQRAGFRLLMKSTNFILKGWNFS